MRLMFDLWTVETIGDDVENAGDSYHLGVFPARSENEAAHVALLNVDFVEHGEWRIEAQRVSVALRADA